MNIKKVDDKPMVIHTKEKPKVHVKGAPETKIKGRNILTVQHGPKIAGSVAEKSVAADGKIKLKRSSVHVTDKRKTVQTKTAADGMEYRGRNGGTVQDRKGNGTTQGRNGATVQGRSGGGTTHGRNEGKTAQGRYADRNTQVRQGKEQEVRQSVNKENRMYAQYCNSLFIANGNIYVQIRKEDDDKQYCCTIYNFKKWGGIENLKRFISLKGKKEVKTIADLMDAVIECGYSREVNYFEYSDIENDFLLENSDYKYRIDEFTFQDYPNFKRGFNMNRTGFRESEGRIFHDGDINFSLDLSDKNGGIRKDLPECVLKEIEREVNKLLEVNFVKLEDIGQAIFTCYANACFTHSRHIKSGKHCFYRNYSIHIEIDKISEYYNEFDLDSVDMKFLKHADFYLCDRSWTEKPFDEFIRDEIFCQC